MVAKEVRQFNITPRIAMLSYSNFGSSNSPEARLVAEARKLVKQKMPSLIVDGEMQASVAFNNELMKENYPFSELVDKNVNTLIFPNLASGNVAYNLLKELDTADAIGPILLGLKKTCSYSTTWQFCSQYYQYGIDRCCRCTKKQSAYRRDRTEIKMVEEI
jgi:malate dehydrogenase (oxaloacetate-decarboxylating)(NADP+)